MSDDLDDQLRRTMKTLDDQVPSGYFEALPTRTLARLESSMQQGTSGPTKQEQSTGVPPPVAAREEDSGLHDIRNLAQSTKQRLSSRRISTSPVATDEDVLGNSSASWKNLALPQPAKMVSLPSLDELPSKQEVLAQDKLAKQARAAQARGDAPPATAVSAREPRPVAKRGKGPILAIGGMAIAAAAGAVIFMQASGTKNAEPRVADVAAPATQAASVPAPAPPPVQIAAAAGSAVEPEPQAAKPDVKVDEAPPVIDTVKKPTAKTPPPAKHAGKALPVTKAADPEVKPEPPKPDKAEKTKGGEGEPSFDDLLKEAGVDRNKKEAKPKLDKKSLSGDDFKNGMASVASKAQGCYKGTQGTATVKLTIAPSGQVSKVSVGGQFAGKAEAACVAGAVKSASFPAWDGGPQSFNYSYLLSE